MSLIGGIQGSPETLDPVVQALAAIIPHHPHESWPIVFRPKTYRRGRQRSRGQSLVEFAIVFPIFMLVLAGLLDFGFLLYNRISVINAAREGARAASVSAAFSDFAPNAQGAVQSTAPGGPGAKTCGQAGADCQYSVSCVRTAGSCNFNSAAGYKSGVGGDSVSVTVTYAYHSFFGSFFGAVINVSSTVQMVIE
ncbi:MAG TPA: TadE/TadG family type IV pilus assembly protein [Candidatus Acidoferrum sp.]|nr:TadE/TadG family type IV pilus assembly protein [Candidatus Acidoferrum sp.]